MKILYTVSTVLSMYNTRSHITHMPEHAIAHLKKPFHGFDAKQNEAYDLAKTLTTNKAYNMADINRTTNINSRPLPMPTLAPVCDVQSHSTPSPPHIYEEPRLTETVKVRSEAILRSSHMQV